jgi:hypothetical protein
LEVRVKGSLFVATAFVAVAGSAFAQTPSFCNNYPQIVGSGDWQASRVFYQSGRLSYVTDSSGNRVPDYSYAGYGYGAKNLPSIPTVTTLQPASGDQTSRINSALSSASSPGAVMLAAGTWEIRGTIVLNRSGIVLRGAGDSTSGTVLRATGDTPHQRPVIRMGSGNGAWTTTGSTTISDSNVPVNATSFTVASTSGLAVGNDIRIFHPSTSAWISAVGGGGMTDDADWTPGQIDIEYIRRITAISGSRITVDAPIYNHLNRSLAVSTVSRITNVNAIKEAGVENLRVDIVTASSTDENHAWNGVDVIGAHDSWVRGVTALHFGSAGIVLENAVRVTVDDCQSLDPHGVRTGGRFYNFNNERRSQLNLFRNCVATLGRHGYISNGVSLSSGIVYTRSSQQGGGSEGGHRMWVQGVLYDNIDETSSGQVLLINRGDFGTSHGWACAHCTVWKYDGETLAQKPPTAQNYAFNVAGTFRSSVYWPGPFGIQERQSGRLVPESLYEAQLCDRLENGGPTPPPPTPTPTPTSPGPTPTPTATPAGPTPTPTNTPVGPTPTPTSTPTGGFSGYYRLMARHSGKAMTVQSASTANSANVFQWTYGGTNTNDEWQLLSIGGGYYRAIARHSGKDLVVASASTAEGANIFQFAYGGTATNDEWEIIDVGSGYHRITNRNSGKSAEVVSAGTADGADVVQRTYSGGTHQQWQIISVP